jgi:hypothetical protein
MRVKAIQAFRLPITTLPAANGKRLRANLYAAARRPIRAMLLGKPYVLNVRIHESFGEDAFAVSIRPVARHEESRQPSFTAKQGQYLAFIHHYIKLHRSLRPNRICRSISALLHPPFTG